MTISAVRVSLSPSHTLSLSVFIVDNLDSDLGGIKRGIEERRVYATYLHTHVTFRTFFFMYVRTKHKGREMDESPLLSCLFLDNMRFFLF